MMSSDSSSTSRDIFILFQDVCSRIKTKSVIHTPDFFSEDETQKIDLWAQQHRQEDETLFPLRVDRFNLKSKEQTSQPFLRVTFPSVGPDVNFYQLPSEQELEQEWYQNDSASQQHEWGLFSFSAKNEFSFVSVKKNGKVIQPDLQQASLFHREFDSIHHLPVCFTREGSLASFFLFLFSSSSSFSQGSSEGPIHSFTFSPLEKKRYMWRWKAFVSACRFFHTDFTGHTLSPISTQESVTYLQALIFLKAIHWIHCPLNTAAAAAATTTKRNLSSSEMYWIHQHKAEIDQPSQFLTFPNPRRSLWWSPFVMKWFFLLLTEKKSLFPPLFLSFFPFQSIFLHGLYSWQFKSIFGHRECLSELMHQDQIASILKQSQPFVFQPKAFLTHDQTQIVQWSRVHDFFFFSFFARYPSQLIEKIEIPQKETALECFLKQIKDCLDVNHTVFHSLYFFRIWMLKVLKIHWEEQKFQVICHPFLYDLESNIEISVPFLKVKSILEDVHFPLYCPFLSILLQQYVYQQEGFTKEESKALLDRFQAQTQTKF
jgi:hypothetical protein